MTQQYSNRAGFRDYLKSWPLYLLPHHFISRVILKLTRVKPFKNQVIRWFIRTFNVDLSQAVIQDVTQFKHFNAFFTRELTPGARSIAQQIDAIACPADGTISALGPIESGQIIQAKGHNYSLVELLGNDPEYVSRYLNGRFATIYLSPRDYHRVHMPIEGRLTRQTLIPGRLFSVGSHTVRTVPRLFARNERLVVQFDTAIGAMAVILVGAINVGAIETVWSGLVTPPAGKKITRTDYNGSDAITLTKGAEMGRFNMGSTVIVLFEDSVAWDAKLQSGTGVKMGESIATIQSPAEPIRAGD